MRRCALSLIALVAAIGCGDPPPPDRPTKETTPAKPRVTTTGPPQSVSFALRFAETENKTNAAMRSALVESRVFDELVAGLNRDLTTRAPISIEVVDCGQPNAFYNAERRVVSVCYEMVALISESFDDIKSDAEHRVATLGATVFIFFHELGHALIHTLELSFTGREEDAVDQLATLLLVGAGREGAQAARDGAALFAQLAETRGENPMPLWAEHSLEEQRFFNVLCWIYGSDTKAHADLVSDGVLPSDRAGRCPDEWTRLKTAWSKLLQPHRRR